MPSAQPNYLFRFYMGQTVLSPMVQQISSTSEQFADFVEASLNSHAHCGWGVHDDAFDDNERAFLYGDSIFSIHASEDPIEHPEAGRLYITTTADRSATIVRLEWEGPLKWEG